MNNIYCPKCQIDFQVETWDSGECPNCKNQFYWYDECTEDYSDCWPAIEWINEEKNE